ncbi:response regulator [Fusibacter bizertensis]|uniref:Stage 0 sporulation protein A homolog n=1 Tax=Fusibacter bizertensis TaxID=1488331 RepID=A0ABT6NBP3_9FIRM|nr:HD domain-containing phosphohydrolase [Fusibacter bizertensis]MDH8677837.1 response regulator [Fusibacter bizertensis]
MSKILIIDDEIMITSTLSTLIQIMLDYEVFTSNDPKELIESGLLDREKIDLVISDFIMPYMNGLDLLSLIKEKQPHIVPILLTGYSDKESAIKSINDLGLYYYLEKPWDNNELIKVIENGIEKSKLEKELKQKLVIIEKKNNEITRLYDLLRRDYDKEMDNVLEFVISLSNLVEAKDAYTENHTRRVADLAISLGKHMLLSKEQLKNIELGAIIHDIGKVSTPEAILNKPGRLTTEEFEVMKDHPEAGARIIKPITALQKSADMVLSHHEKLDGSGYPNGLKASEIDIETRIITVADIFDALYTDRPYRKGMTLEQSMAILDSDASAGKLDIKLVEILHEMIASGELKKIYHEDEI